MTLCIFAFFLICSCYQEELSSISQPSGFSYQIDEVEIVFYTTGNSDEPTVNWGGDKGLFKLGSSLSNEQNNYYDEERVLEHYFQARTPRLMEQAGKMPMHTFKDPNPNSSYSSEL